MIPHCLLCGAYVRSNVVLGQHAVTRACAGPAAETPQAVVRAMLTMYNSNKPLGAIGASADASALAVPTLRIAVDAPAALDPRTQHTAHRHFNVAATVQRKRHLQPNVAPCNGVAVPA